MPWKVEKTDSCPASKPWGCINQMSGEVEGCHATKEDAEAQQAALYANEGNMDNEKTPSVHVRRLQGMRTRTTARMIAYAERNNLGVKDLANVQLPWYEIRSSSMDGGEEAPTVFIYDEIGGSFGIDAKTFATDLAEIDAPRIVVRINSPGGSLFDAMAIHSSILHHPAYVSVYVDSLAASAASVIALAGDEIIMMPGSQFMIHDPSAMEDGNPRDHEQMALFLHRQADNLAEMYAERTGGTSEQWREIMLAETWMFAREAVQCGIATKVAEIRKPIADPELEPLMTRRHDLSQFRYAGRSNAPAPMTVRSPVRTEPRAAREAGRGPQEMTTEKRSAASFRGAALSQLDVIPGRSFRSAERMPGSVARMVPFNAPTLRAEQVTRNGVPYYEISGQASVYDTPYPMWDEYGPYDEVVEAGAGERTLAAHPDVAFLVNHRGLTMARTTNNTLELSTSDGLDVMAWTNPKRDDVQRLVLAIDDKLITEMSFAFMIDEGRWSDDFTTFYIRQFDINRGDVSAVNYGANPFTSIAARQRDIMADLDRFPPHMARAAMARLAMRAENNAAFVRISSLVDDEPKPEKTPASLTRQSADRRRSLSSVEHLVAIWDEEDRRRELDAL